MTNEELHKLVIERFMAIPQVQECLDEVVEADIVLDAYDLKEAPDRVSKKLASRPEYQVEVKFRGTIGQAFTETPREYKGTVRGVLARPFKGPGLDCVLVATINAVMAHFGLCKGTCHCNREGHEACAIKYQGFVRNVMTDSNVVLVGYQPYILRSLVISAGKLWTMDRDYDNVTKLRHGNVVTNSGKENRESAKKWADLFICSGSMVCNGTLPQWLDTGVRTVFYGVTIAGIAVLLDLPRLCFAKNFHKQYLGNFSE